MQDMMRLIANCLWLAVGFFWLVGAIVAKRTERSQSSGSRLLHLAMEFVAFFLLFARAWSEVLRIRFVPDTVAVACLGLALTIAGIGFTLWARLWLGRNWSGRITIKEGHQFIQSGPYGLVRHPIYSGFLLAMFGTAILRGEVHSLLGVAVAAVAWRIKSRLEETFLSQEFGPSYAEYQQRVKALVPFVF